MIDTRPLTTRLLSEASQENCDGIEHDLMMEAYHRIIELEASVKGLSGAMLSINRGKQYFIEVGEDKDPCYWQRKEWVDWIIELAQEAPLTNNNQGIEI